MSTDTDTKPARQWVVTHYTDEQVERGLLALAELGSSRKASAETGIPDKTLREWRRTTHRERFDQIRTQFLPKIRERIARDAEDLALRYAEAEHEALDALDVTELKPADLANALPRLATARGISTDKANVMRDKPTQITEVRGGVEIINSLSNRFPHLVSDVDADSEDITDAQVDEDTHPFLPSAVR
jgi:hypothetical protein